jgi:lipoprotein-anchoring transpeptidase ErfK/SrfK
MSTTTSPSPTTTPTRSSGDRAPTTDPRPGSTPIGLAALLGLLILLASACSLPGTGGEPIESGAVVDQTTTTTDPLQAELAIEPFVEASARAVVTTGFVDVHNAPGGSATLTLGPTTSFGTTRVLLVEEERDGWVKVRLPVRPNHRSGWIPADQVAVEDLDVEVRVDLATRALTVHRGDLTLLSTPVAVGTAHNPTPTGTFFITDKLETPDPNGAYGPFALGLSGYSETLTEFAGGDGQIGIHGTNDPTSIGADVSHGCIRVPNEIVVQLADLLPLGTPVHIV